ncbi:alpha/beta hydrolase-fold protein [Actinoplanes palleronii]|uniref:Peptidase n=1 Tax=Actinoplanes palleronii TaxID=113570 RepID=A0ABQ4BGN0_9ACTN|nr:alpha/beta hydrolase-fold protein [Actinoplanes palleronii]GIE69846.1 peptidase [Actinoplanes palleronii]
MQRRALLKGVAGALMFSGVAACSAQSGTVAANTSAIAITRVDGDGQKFIAVAVQFTEPIATAKLSAAAFTVDGRTVTKVYANTAAAVAEQGADGRFVIVELSPDDEGAALWTPASGGAAPKITMAATSVTKVGAVTAVSGTVFEPTDTAVPVSSVVSPIVDDFKQLSFADPATGQTLPYNLFVPKGYDPAKAYPLVLYLHGASVAGAGAKGALVQGLGAVAWASPADQAKNPAFVLAPQYATAASGDAGTTLNLLTALTGQYNLDKSRRYVTGQSTGATMALGITAAHPDLFAAAYVVAGRWPATLPKKPLWVLADEGATPASPSPAAHATWPSTATATDVAALEAKKATVNVVGITGGSAEQVAYTLPGIREWIMKQATAPTRAQ